MQVIAVAILAAVEPAPVQQPQTLEHVARQQLLAAKREP